MGTGTEDGYRVLRSNRDIRVGVVTNPEGNIIEVVVDLLPGCPQIDLEVMGGKISLLRSLRDMGYRLLCDGDRFVCAELTVGSQAMQDHLDGLKGMLDRELRTGRGPLRPTSE